MTPGANKVYHTQFWPAACLARGWDKRDQELRRGVVIECMGAVRGPAVTTSDPAFGSDETTALFIYLDFLAHPDDLDRSARWADCQQDYRAFNRARQADWYEAAAYGAGGSKKLQRDRFAGQSSAQGEVLETFDPEAIQRRFVTVASRAQKKARAEGRELRPRNQQKGQRLAGQRTASPAPAVPVNPARVPF